MRKMKMNVYTIVRNETNEVIFVTNSYNNIKDYVMKHFPNYITNDKYEMIVLQSKNFTVNRNKMNYDNYFGEEYK